MTTPQTFVVLARSCIQRRCKECHAPIVFYQHASTGRWMPFDPGVEVLRSFPREGDGLICHDVTGISHFSTCPMADKFRKPKPAAPPMEKLF